MLYLLCNNFHAMPRKSTRNTRRMWHNAHRTRATVIAYSQSKHKSHGWPSWPSNTSWPTNFALCAVHLQNLFACNEEIIPGWP